MLRVRVAVGTTVVEPSSTGSATTVFAGFLENAALGAHRTDLLCDQHGKGGALEACITNETGIRTLIQHITNMHDIRCRQAKPHLQ